MKVCLVSSEHSSWGGIGHATRGLATLLATRHEVTVVYSGGGDGRSRIEGTGVREIVAEPSGEVARTSFSCDDHQRSAATLAAIEEAYGVGGGPDYVEFCDFRGHGLVTLQARRAGHPLLRDTLVGVRACSSSELLCLHDGTLAQPPLRLVAELEREQLRLADRLLWSGGDALDLYRRYYADLSLPEAVRLRHPLGPAEPEPELPRKPGGPLRLLYVGRLQRLKGALDLAEACQGLPSDEWELTTIGADTATAPLGQSVRMTIEAMWGEDPRVKLEEPLPHNELQRRWREHDLLVVPSHVEIWSNVVLEAMRAGLPVLATPVGGLVEQVEPGVTGWLADGIGPHPVRRGLARLLGDRDEVERVRASGAPAERCARLVDPGEILAGYDELIAAGRPTRIPTARVPAERDEPPVTAVVPYYHSAGYAEEAVGSLLAQTHRNLEVLVVNDGSFEQSDDLLDALGADPRVTVVTQLNHGDAMARNLGVRLARGKYVAMLDADNLFEPEFVARAVDLLEREPELAYVTPWLSYIGPDGLPLPEAAGYAPLGNSVVSSDAENWDGDMIAVFPRRLAELGYAYEPAAALHGDWELYRQLRQDGMFGAVIPEPLARYRVRPSSLSRSYDEAAHAISMGEEASRRELRRVRWTAETG